MKEKDLKVGGKNQGMIKTISVTIFFFFIIIDYFDSEVEIYLVNFEGYDVY